jgi:hypothetical protein
LNRLDGKNDAPERAPQTRMSLARDVLRGYTGEYRYEGSHPFALEIEAVEEHLRVCADLLPRPFDLYPSSPVDFFFDNIDVRLHFVMGEGGAVQGVNVRFPSFESFAKRVG